MHIVVTGRICISTMEHFYMQFSFCTRIPKMHETLAIYSFTVKKQKSAPFDRGGAVRVKALSFLPRTGGEGVVTEVTCGSLLDDNIWHDVHISRFRKELVFSVDRVVVRRVLRGDSFQLDLNNEVRLPPRQTVGHEFQPRAKLGTTGTRGARTHASASTSERHTAEFLICSGPRLAILGLGRGCWDTPTGADLLEFLVVWKVEECGFFSGSSDVTVGGCRLVA